MENTKNIHDGHRKRLKERFLKGGMDGLSDINCLELLLFYALPRRDTNPIAHALLEQFGSLSGVLDAPPEQLLKISGISEHAATLLHIIPQLARRYMMDQTGTDNILTTAKHYGEYLMPCFVGAREEQVYLLCLDAKCKVLDCRLISKGSLNSANVPIRKIAEVALTIDATGVVLAHNHTSGIALPSREDIALTTRLLHALDAMGIELVDHIIIADDDFVSMAESNLISYR